MGKISRLRLHVAPAPRDWRTEGIRPEELDLLCRGAGLRQGLSAATPKRANGQAAEREESGDA